MCLVVFLITKYTLVEHKLSFQVGSILYGASQLVIFAIPTILLMKVDISPLLRGCTCMQICTHSMKAHSFWETNWMILRDKLNSSKTETIDDDEILNFPTNLNLRNFVYFMLAPTLLYETHYPQTNKIRISYLVKFSLLFLLVVLVDFIIRKSMLLLA
eukprot:TRINITY_DN373_c0_g1_i2.p1 TRINITY_DN373_c0_g1~~TRINITY_DN373_c0_g1_i2.p1  ORF type:complete len:158 (+),score=5.55 TRINITY_DN373_c0_g1_i2:124-597(+)